MNTRRRFPKPRTIIKRGDTLLALSRLIDGKKDGVYAERLVNFAQEFFGIEQASE